jgi:3-phenylpropionate/cinnamic acid dioxygenase small subunit
MRNEPLPDDKLIREVEQFLYREARLLDERRFHQWLRGVHLRRTAKRR